MSALCTACGGTGVNEKGKPCPDCGGEGELPDGFRKAKKRPKGWEAKALKDGVIALEPPPHQTYSDTQTVVQPPVATLTADKE